MADKGAQLMAQGNSATEKLARDMDWSAVELGPPQHWPAELRIAAEQVFSCPMPMFVAWGPKLEVIYNDAYVPILGTKHPRAMGQPHLETWEEARELLEPLVQRAVAGEPILVKDMAFTIERGAGLQQAWFTFAFNPLRRTDGSIAGIQCVCLETTDKVAALVGYRESEQRLQLSLDASGSIGTWSVEPETSTTFLDERFARLFQVDAALAEGGTELERLVNMIHPEDRQRVAEAVAYAIAHRSLYDIEYRIPQKSGRDIWVAARGRMFGAPYFGKERFAGIALDITRQKETELALAREVNERKKIEEELRLADRRKDEFLAMLAHELRNPLAPIRTASELLLRAKIDEAQVRETSAVISRQVEHMTSLVDDLMDVSRVTRGLVMLDLKEVDMARIVADAVEQVRPLIASKRHELAIHLPAEAIHLLGDGKRLIQILGNLLNNAAKYTPEEGRIAVRVQLPASDRVMVSVQDNGIGISPELAGRAFELFTQADRTLDRTQGGLGIGLALVRSLAELHGGTVSVVSGGPGVGCEFTVSLPRLAAPRPERSQRDESLVSLRQNPLRVLVVDDNEDAAATLGMFLEMEGHEVMIEKTAHDGLARARSHLPDVCLLDIGLPEMDGMEMARQIRADARLRHAMLVAVTGYGQEKDRQKTASAGFDHHLVKPVNPAHLTKLLAGVGSRTGSPH